MNTASNTHIKKKVLLPLIASVIALCIVGLSGCAGPSPTEVTTQFLDGIKNGDSEAVMEVYAGDYSPILEGWQNDDSSEGAEDASAVPGIEEICENELLPKLQEFDYEILSEQIDGDSATVEVKITTYAVGNAMSSFMTDYISQGMALAFTDASDEQLNELATSIFSSKIKSMDKTYTDTVTFSLSKEDNAWKVDAIDEDGEIADAFFGGLVSSLESLDTVYGGDE